MWYYVDWPIWRLENCRKNWNIYWNESEVDDIKEEKAKASEEKLFHKHKKSKPKSSFFI